MNLNEMGKQAKQAAAILSQLSHQQKNNALQIIAEQLELQSDKILAENAKDIQLAKENGLSEALIDRLLLTKERIAGIAKDVRHIISLADPVGQVIDGGILESGAKLERVRVQDIRDMREKMYQHLSKHQADKFNIKTDRGGITDIEFIAQYLVLAHAPANPTLTHWSDNVRIFDSMAESAVISQQVCEDLKKCYVNLRNQIHHLNLLGEDSVINVQEFSDERKIVRDIWNNLFA